MLFSVVALLSYLLYIDCVIKYFRLLVATSEKYSFKKWTFDNITSLCTAAKTMQFSVHLWTAASLNWICCALWDYKCCFALFIFYFQLSLDLWMGWMGFCQQFYSFHSKNYFCSYDWPVAIMGDIHAKALQNSVGIVSSAVAFITQPNKSCNRAIILLCSPSRFEIHCSLF